MSAPRKRIVVLISGSGTNMAAIIAACQANQIHGDVVAVLSNQAQAGGLVKAKAAGVPALALPHTDFASREAYDAALVKQVQSFSPDLVVLAGFMRVLTPVFVGAFADRILNIHPSLLPKYRGLHTHQRALDAGDTEHGVSVHFVTEELDGGPVILQASVPIFADDTADDLQARVHAQEYRIYPLVIRWFCADRLVLGESGAVLDGELLGPQGYAVDD